MNGKTRTSDGRLDIIGMSLKPQKIRMNMKNATTNNFSISNVLKRDLLSVDHQKIAFFKHFFLPFFPITIKRDAAMLKTLNKF